MTSSASPISAQEKIFPDVLPTFGDRVTYAPVPPEKRPKPIPPREDIQVPLAYAFASRKTDPFPWDHGSADALNAGLIKGYSFLFSSPAAAHDACERSRTALLSWAETIPDEGQRLGETDIAKKLSIQRRFHPQWYVKEPVSFKPMTADHKRALSVVVRHYARVTPPSVMRADPFSLAMESLTPTDTNSGWPCYSTDFAIRVAGHAALGLRGWPAPDELVERMREFCDATGLEHVYAPYALSRRAGPLAKPLPVYDHLPDGALQQTGEIMGCYSRARTVFMAASFMSDLAAAAYIQWKSGRMAISGNDHSAGPRRFYMKKIADLVKQGYHMGESDFSGYDDSISPEVRLYAYGELEKAGYHAPGIRALAWLTRYQSVLSPSYSQGPTLGFASVSAEPSGLRSGIIDTSNMGTLNANAVVTLALIQQGLLTWDQAERQLPFHLCQSDDALLITAKPVDPAKYEATCEECGLKVKYFPGRRMLMRHIYPDHDYAVAARVVQQTLFNEDAYEHLGQVLLGVSARVGSGLTSEGWAFLQPWFQSGVIDGEAGPILAAAAKPAAHPEAMAKTLLAHPKVAEFLASRRGASWLVKLTELALSSPSAARQLEFLTSQGFSVSLDSAIAQRRYLLTSLLSPNKQQITQSLHLVQQHFAR